jgi:hypothetical protein
VFCSHQRRDREKSLPGGEGVVKKTVLATTMSVALLNNAYASSLPNCGDRESLQVIEGMMRDTAHKQVDSMGDLQLQMYVTSLIQQMVVNALANGKVESPEPTCVPEQQGGTRQIPGIVPTDEDKAVAVAIDNAVAQADGKMNKEYLSNPANTLMLRKSGKLPSELKSFSEAELRSGQDYAMKRGRFGEAAPIKQLPPCEPKKAETQKEMDINQVRVAMGVAIDNTIYKFSAPRVDGDLGNKKFCAINLNTSGVSGLGQPFSLNFVEEYTVQLTEEGKYWIELNKETRVK